MDKLTIEAFTKKNFTGSVGKMTVQFNPEKLALSWGSPRGKTKSYSVKMASGTTKETKVIRLTSGMANFDLIFDDTLSKVGKSINESISRLKELCLAVNSEAHATNYIILTWGTFIFKCQLRALSVNYVLFMPDGTPLRAEVSCTFKGFQDALSLSKEEGLKSPDMTRVVTVKEGDTLPLLCYEHYNSNRHYLKVARVNGLASPSYLRPGQRIVFPPLVDEVEMYYD